MKFVVVGGGGRADGGGGGSGYRIKNKNPTQSCGEESPHLQECPGASTWFHVMLQIVELRTLLGSIEKRMLSRLQAMQHTVNLKKVMPGTAAHGSTHT